MRRSLAIFAALALVAPTTAFMPTMAPSHRGATRGMDLQMSSSQSPSVSRRQALGVAAALAAGLVAMPLRDATAADAPKGPFLLPTLPYDYKALEPAIDEGADLWFVM